MANIYKRGRVWYLYYRVNGRRVRKRIGTSKKVAELALSDTIVKLEKKEIGFGLPPKKKKGKGIGEFLREYRRYSETNHRQSTVRRYQDILGNFLTFLKLHPEIKTLLHLSPQLFEAYKTYKRQMPTTGNGKKRSRRSKPSRTGANPRTINSEIQVLRTLFGLAVKWGYLEKNPVAGVGRLEVESPRGRLFLTKPQVQKLLASCSGQFRNILVMFLNTGFRKGELINLTWDDVDFDRNVVKVMQGIDLSTVKELLGHTSIETTMIYAHLAPEHKQKAVEVLEFGGVG